MSHNTLVKMLKIHYGLSTFNLIKYHLISRYYFKCSSRLKREHRRLEKLAGNDPNSPIAQVLEYRKTNKTVIDLIGKW